MVFFFLSFYYQCYCKCIRDKPCYSSDHISSVFALYKFSSLHGIVFTKTVFVLFISFDLSLWNNLPCCDATVLYCLNKTLIFANKCLLHLVAGAAFQRICNSLLKHHKCSTQTTFLFINNITLQQPPQDLVDKYFVRIHEMKWPSTISCMIASLILCSIE